MVGGDINDEDTDNEVGTSRIDSIESENEITGD